MKNAIVKIYKTQGDGKNIQEMLKKCIEKNTALTISSLSFQSSKAALHSVHGSFCTSEGKQMFFKMTENLEDLKNENNNIKMLTENGYSILKNTFFIEESDVNVLVFDFVQQKTYFDLLGPHFQCENNIKETLLNKYKSNDLKLKNIYKNTLTLSSPSEHSSSPVHTLFHERISGERYQNWYEKKSLFLNNQEIQFSDFKNLKWNINGVSYKSLQDLIQKAQNILDPTKKSRMTIVGHGDGHHGNVFFDTDQGCIYFDPAFAGRHTPFLDVAKPLFHNSFAQWMYYPEYYQDSFQLDVKIEDNTVMVSHNYKVEDIFEQFFYSKIDNLLLPFVEYLKQKDCLEDDWKEYLQSALFCCAFLTKNLLDREMFSEKMMVLGMCVAVEVGLKRYDEVFGYSSLEKP